MSKDTTHADKAAAQLSDTAKRIAALKGGGVDHTNIEDKAKAAEALVNDITQNGSKMLDGNALLKVAGAHASDDTKAMLGHANTLSSDGLNVGSITKILASGDTPIGRNGHVQEFAKLYQGVLEGKENPDVKKVEQVPGMVVNKETGHVNLFGIEALEVPAQVANMIAVGYSVALPFVNGWLFDKGYKAGKATGHALNLDALGKHRIGQAAAYGAIFGATFWPDINMFVRNETDFRKGSKALASDLAPVLDDLKGGHSVANLFAVHQDENEMVFNERRRMGAINNAQRLEGFAQAVGRSVTFIVGAIEGKQKIAGLENKAKQDAQTEKLAQSPIDATRARDQQLRERAKQIREDLGEFVKPEEALKRAEAELDAKAGIKNADKADATKPLGDKFTNMMYMGAALANIAAQGVGSSLLGNTMKHVQPISAFDMIKALKSQLDDNPKQAKFSLPKGMKIEGAKGSAADEISLADYIVQIFQQHEKDCYGNDGKVPARLHERLHEVAQKIAQTLADGDVDGMALVKLVGERKILRKGSKTIASDDAVNHELEKAKARMRHVDWVDEREYFADASFSKEQLKSAWKAMADDEKDFFVSLVPSQVMESVGVKSEEIKLRRDRREQIFKEDVSAMLQGAIQLGDEKLGQLSLQKDEISLLKSAAEKSTQGDDRSLDAMLPGAGHDKTINTPLTELLVHHLNYGGKLSDLVQRAPHH